MKFQINHKLLSDSPFCTANEGLFTAPHEATEDLIQDISNGTATCYLISGYRGAGKSSFIKRIEQRIKNKSQPSNATSKKESSHSNEVVFVHVNFSRYQSQTFLLRKLIRGLYLEIKDYPSFIEYKKNEEGKPLSEKTIMSLESLYEKTFYDTSFNTSNSDKKETTTSLTLDILALLNLITPIVFFVLFVLNSHFKFIEVGQIINLIGIVGAALLAIKEIKYTVSKNSTEQQDFNRKSLYDDEIADHHFFQTLHLLQQKNYNVIFVLDELDKVEDEDLEKLLKEMKPYLVCGAASFIAVAGQNLYYKYVNAKSTDDHVLSSIFSRFIHIPLFSRDDMKGLFNRLIVGNQSKFNPAEKKLLDHYVDYLIFESKKVPRKFVSLIRQNLTWSKNKSYIEINQSEESFAVFSQVLDIIEKIDDDEIAPEGFDEVLRDYFIMQLLTASHKIFFSKRQTFSEDEIIGGNG